MTGTSIYPIGILGVGGGATAGSYVAVIILFSIIVRVLTGFVEPSSHCLNAYVAIRLQPQQE